MFDEDGTNYHVVVNHEGQYSVWPVNREIPAGWNAHGTPGTLKECTDYVDLAWTDMRPLSLQRRMEDSEGRIT
jgi:MbtH protein